MKKLLPTKDREFIISNVKYALDTGKEWKNDDIHYPLYTLFNTISEIDSVIMLDDDFTTNGSDVDWFQPILYRGEKYELFGSLWKGGLHLYKVN